MMIGTEHRGEHVHKVAPDGYSRGRRGRRRVAHAHWQESFTARLEALALLETLNTELLSHDSATLTLDHWCAAHRLASPAHIVAERVNGADQAPTDEQRQLLGVSATEPIGYRRVRLTCGDHVLSEADNW